MIPQNILQSMLKKYSNKLGWLYNRDFALAPVIDWSWLSGIGIVTKVERYWTKLFVGDSFTFQCNGWHNLFKNGRPGRHSTGPLHLDWEVFIDNVA